MNLLLLVCDDILFLWKKSVNNADLNLNILVQVNLLRNVIRHSHQLSRPILIKIPKSNKTKNKSNAKKSNNLEKNLCLIVFAANSFSTLMAIFGISIFCAAACVRCWEADVSNYQFFFQRKDHCKMNLFTLHFKTISWRGQRLRKRVTFCPSPTLHVLLLELFLERLLFLIFVAPSIH